MSLSNSYLATNVLTKSLFSNCLPWLLRLRIAKIIDQFGKCGTLPLKVVTFSKSLHIFHYTVSPGLCYDAFCLDAQTGSDNY